jgi:hypothetical protein
MDTYIMRIAHTDLLTNKPWGFAIHVGDWPALDPFLREHLIVDAKLKMGERLATEKQIVLRPRDYELMHVSVWRYDEDNDLEPERVQ